MPSEPGAVRAEKSVKRRQSLKAKSTAPPPPIACHTCGQTDVPLMMGGSELVSIRIQDTVLLTSTC